MYKNDQDPKKTSASRRIPIRNRKSRKSKKHLWKTPRKCCFRHFSTFFHNSTPGVQLSWLTLKFHQSKTYDSYQNNDNFYEEIIDLDQKFEKLSWKCCWRVFGDFLVIFRPYFIVFSTHNPKNHQFCTKSINNPQNFRK